MMEMDAVTQTYSRSPYGDIRELECFRYWEIRVVNKDRHKAYAVAVQPKKGMACVRVTRANLTDAIMVAVIEARKIRT